MEHSGKMELLVNLRNFISILSKTFYLHCYFLLFLFFLISERLVCTAKSVSMVRLKLLFGDENNVITFFHQGCTIFVNTFGYPLTIKKLTIL
jgi:hypothetical protein